MNRRWRQRRCPRVTRYKIIATTGATPFRFNLHVGDLGHTLMIGPPGAGKSTFLGLAAAQWFRYPRAQVFAFDKGYSLFTLTQAAGGEFFGHQRLADLVSANHHISGDEIADSILEAADRFSGGLHPTDDRTLLVLKVQ